MSEPNRLHQCPSCGEWWTGTRATSEICLECLDKLGEARELLPGLFAQLERLGKLLDSGDVEASEAKAVVRHIGAELDRALETLRLDKGAED